MCAKVYNHFIILCNSTLKQHRSTRKKLSLFVLVPRRQMREIREGIIFSWSIRWYTFDLCGERRFFPLEIPKKLNFYYNHKREQITPSLFIITDISMSLVGLRNYPQMCFSYRKLFLLNSCKISRKLPIMENDFSNVTVTTLLKLSQKWILFLE